MSTTLFVPSKLPLLEALCWNIKNPYGLTFEEKLDVYERAWRFKDVLAEPSIEEIKFINQLALTLNLYPITTMTKDKQQHYQHILTILNAINVELLYQCQAYLGGGTLINLETNCFRYSADINFICSSVAGYKLLRQQILREGHQSLFKDLLLSEITLERQPKIDLYGVRFPVKVAQSIPIKLEIITENRLHLKEPYFPDWNPNLASLSVKDRYILKLMANSDRYLDKSVFSRDLIDLAMLRNSYFLSDEIINEADAIYGVKQQFIEAITSFQSDSSYREKCYQKLQIEQPFRVINGLDLLAENLGLEVTERTFKETDFSYLK